ncbi:MAG: hypothetical protein IQL11_06550 [Bacteroidales bacterium]|nr:hypothetical protein [Bacteroidales bacterium]
MNNSQIITGCICIISLLTLNVTCRRTEEKLNVLFIFADPLTAEKTKPPEYNHRKLVREPDKWQPEYTLRKYFGRKD